MFLFFDLFISSRVNDVIVKVNESQILGVSHEIAVDALKRAGNTVHMVRSFLLIPIKFIFLVSKPWNYARKTGIG